MDGVKTGRYEIIRQLGRGGMGEVYLAQDLELGRKVALKFMRAGTEGDVGARQRFVREARASAAIDHPFICKIYDVGEIDGRVFIAMEYLEGQTLRNRMDEGPLPWDAIKRIVLEISEALLKAHQTGIIHRDLKPANIMEISDGHIKVLDFGLAKWLIDLPIPNLAATEDTLTIVDQTAFGKVVGTPSYMAPEQLRGVSVDARADLFALGIMFHELVAGAHPFRRKEPMDTVNAILNDVPQPVSQYRADCPPEIDSIVARLLEKDPAARYQSVREFTNDLRNHSAAESRRDAEALSAMPSLAVLPFVNRSADPEQEYFSDGITEDLISEISMTPGLKVIGRTSVMALKNSGKDLSEIARDLGVSNVLAGSIRKAGDRVRITCGLVDVKTKVEIWSQVYDRDLTDIFAIQSEVAKKITATLSRTLSTSSGEQKIVPPKNAEAYQVYLKARFFMNKATPESINKSIRYFQRAIVLDPTNARAYAGLSNCYAVAGHWDFISPQEAAINAKAAANNALALDERSAEAHTSLAMALLQEWDWEGCDRHFRRAIELNPNSVDARVFYSWYLCTAKRIEEALVHVRHATELDPLSVFVSAIRSWVLILAGHFDEAIQRLEDILEIDPTFVMAHAELAHAYVGKGRYEEACESIEKGAWRRALPLITWLHAGRISDVKAHLSELTQSRNIEQERPSEIAYLYLMLGDREKAAEWLEKAFQVRDYMIVMHTCAAWVPLFEDPMILDYQRRMGLSE